MTTLSGTLALDPLVPDRDAALIHSWVVEDRARFWMMGDHTVEEVREIYTWIDEQPTHHAWLVRLDGEPDARNAKAVALVRRLGFELGPLVELSTKPAQLAFLTRETYGSAFPNHASA